jgi:hypothetical protein
VHKSECRHEIFSVVGYNIPSCLFFPEEKGASYLLLFLEETTDRGARTDSHFSISFNARREEAGKTVTDHGCNCISFHFYLSFYTSFIYYLRSYD